MLRRGTFNASDLARLPAPVRPVMLKSGGPIMEAESSEADQVLCRWMDDDKVARAVFGRCQLYSLVPYLESAD
jgi:uncharacterized protein YodC (DUF2158 family)